MRNHNEIHGLSGLILDAMINATATLVGEGEEWTPTVLNELQASLHRELAPAESTRQRMIFDMVFNRAFSEASDQLMTLVSLNQANQDEHRVNNGQATA